MSDYISRLNGYAEMLDGAIPGNLPDTQNKDGVEADMALPFAAALGQTGLDTWFLNGLADYLLERER